MACISAPLPLLTARVTDAGETVPGGSPRKTLRVCSANASSRRSTEAPPLVMNGVTGRAWVTIWSPENPLKARPRSTMSPMLSSLSTVRLSAVELTMSLMALTSRLPKRSWERSTMARIRTCCRLMRPRSPLGSLAQRSRLSLYSR